MVWRAAERENFVSDTQAMRKRVVAHIPAREQGRELKLGEGGLRDVEFSVQLLQLVHGRVDERLRTRATLPALKALVDTGYVGREDGKGFGLAYRFLRTLEHRIQLFQLRRTHVLPDAEPELRRLGRSLGYADPVEQLLSTWRHCSARVRRLHERLFYSPLLDVVARIPSSELRLTTDAAVDRLKALGYADPRRGAAAHRRAQPGRLPAGGDPAPAAAGDARLVRRARRTPTPGLLAFRQVSEALGTTPWYLRALRDEGAMAERLARILASSRFAVSLLTRAPQTVQMLAGAEELRPRPLADLARRDAGRRGPAGAARPPGSRRSAPSAAGSCSGSRRPTCWASSTCWASGRRSATWPRRPSTRRWRWCGPAPPTRRRCRPIAVIAMGRWGGHEMSYASDCDAMFVMADAAAGAEGGDPTRAAAAVISEMRQAAGPAGRRPGAGRRRRPAARGQGRRADPLADGLPELLRPLVLDLGAAGAGPGGRRWPATRALGADAAGRDRRAALAGRAA